MQQIAGNFNSRRPAAMHEVDLTQETEILQDGTDLPDEAHSTERKHQNYYFMVIGPSVNIKSTKLRNYQVATKEKPPAPAIQELVNDR